VLVIPTNPYNANATTKLPDLRRMAKAYAEKFLVGLTVTNEATGDNCLITMGGIKHTIHGASPPLLRTLTVLPTLLKQAEKTGEVPDKLNRPDILRIHKYELTLVDEYSELVALAVIRETTTNRYFYDLSFLSK
jgi:hypothetical protein